MADLQALEDYYTNLLIIQYHDKEKAQAVIKNWVDCMVADGFLLDLDGAYSPDSAVGVQLDTLGKILGLDRNNLSDDEYRTLLNFKIITNNCGVSMKEIDDVLWAFFGKSVICHNNQDMSLTYIVFPEYEPLIPLFQSEQLLPAPLGVGVNIVISVDLPDLIFGFKRGNIVTEAVGFSTKNGLTEGKFLDKDNIVSYGS